MQIRSVFGQTKVSVNSLSKAGDALFGEAALQLFPVNSVDKAVLRLRTLPLGITWSEDENKIISEDSQGCIHIINLYNSFFKTSQLFCPVLLKTKLCATVTGNCALCWTVFIYCEMFKSREPYTVLMIIKN